MLRPPRSQDWKIPVVGAGGLEPGLGKLLDDVLGRGASAASAHRAAFEDIVGERVDVVLELGGGDGICRVAGSVARCGRRLRIRGDGNGGKEGGEERGEQDGARWEHTASIARACEFAERSRDVR